MLLNIINKYKGPIFENGIYGLPDFLTISNMNNLKEQAIDQAKDLVNQGVQQAKNKAKNVANSAVNSVADAASSGLKELGFDSEFGFFSSLFEQFDKDKSGFIDYEEFVQLCKYMGLHMDKDKSLKLFSKADPGCNQQIEMREFTLAVTLIKLEIAQETLRKLGVTTEDLLVFALGTMGFLLLLLMFVFLGIFAFSKAEGFNAVINSLLPLAAGAAAAARKIDLEGTIEKVKAYIKQAFTMLKGKE